MRAGALKVQVQPQLAQLNGAQGRTEWRDARSKEPPQLALSSFR